MDAIEKSLSMLDKYLSETNPEIIEKYIQEVAALQIPGPLVSEYFTGYETEFEYNKWLVGNSSVGIIQGTFDSDETSQLFYAEQIDAETGLMNTETNFAKSNLSDSFRITSSPVNEAA